MTSTIQRPKIMIGMGTCGMGAGAKGVLTSIEDELKKQKLKADIVRTGCIGMCSHEVLVDIMIPGRTRVTYGKVKPKTVPQIIEEHVGKGELVKKLAMSQMYHGGRDVAPYRIYHFLMTLK